MGINVERLRALMAHHNLSQNELSRRAHEVMGHPEQKGQGGLSRILSGKIRNPEVRTIQAYAVVLGTTFDYLTSDDTAIVDPREDLIERAANRGAEKALAKQQPDRAIPHAPIGADTAGAVRATLSDRDTALQRRAAEVGVEVALRFSRGEPTDDVIAYIRQFEADVRAAKRAALEEHDAPTAGDCEGATAPG